jgi:hypothetical protein
MGDRFKVKNLMMITIKNQEAPNLNFEINFILQTHGYTLNGEFNPKR